VSGVVKTVDAEKSTLTVNHPEGESTFTVAKDARISIDGMRGDLAGLPAGATVTLSQFVDRKTTGSIEAVGPQVSGVVKAVDAGKGTLTLADRTFTVAADANISIDFKPGKLAAVPAGAHVTLTLRADQKTAHNVQVGGETIFGRARAVDPGRSTITVAGNPHDRTFRVAAETNIHIDGKPGKLSGIPAGACLHALNLCADQKTVHSINVEGPGVHNVPVKAVDAEKGTLTFNDKAPAEVAGKTIVVAPDARISIDGRAGKLASVPAGAFLSLTLSVDSTTVRWINAEGPNIGGCGGSMVKAVDAVKGTITFDDKACAEVAGKTFPVAANASISIDGNRGTLAGLPAGSFVNLRLCVDRQTARHVFAQGPSVCGALKEVDAEKSTISVADKTYPVAKDAIIGRDNGRCTLSGLPAGARVTLVLRVDQKTVARIHATEP
jgi:hypothetical protein